MVIGTWWRRATAVSKIVLVIYILAFVGATYNHISDIITGGWFPYVTPSERPFLFNLFWTSLTFIDPLAVLLLIIRVRAGVWFYLVVMVSDVSVNIYSQLVYGQVPFEQNTRLLLQIAFLIFLLATFRLIIIHTRVSNSGR